MNDKPTPTPTEADIACARECVRIAHGAHGAQVKFAIAAHVAASVDRATAELRDTIERCESVIADIRRENETRRIDFTAIIRSYDSTVSRLREALRLIAEQWESRRPPAWCQIAEQARAALAENTAIEPPERLRHAVNSSCDCGGRGPEDPQCCPACKVWHKMGEDHWDGPPNDMEDQ